MSSTVKNFEWREKFERDATFVRIEFQKSVRIEWGEDGCLNAHKTGSRERQRTFGVKRGRNWALSRWAKILDVWTF